jgi:hypothetical protein
MCLSPKTENMQRQRLHWLLCTLAALLIVFLAAELLLWAEGNTALAKFNKVEPGMTIEQVERLIGPASVTFSSRGDGTRMWCFPRQCAFQVYFDENGKVTSKEVCEGSLQNKETTLGEFIKKLLQKIGL